MARKVDDLGRIVLPIELRRSHDIHTGDALEISVDGDAIVLRKVASGCVFCSSDLDLREHLSRPVCGSCARALADGAADSR